MHESTDTGKTPQQLFLQHLKSATLPQHEALERNPHSTTLVSPTLTREQYLGILQHFYGFVVPVEVQVYPLLDSILGGMDKFKRGAWLREDLSALGMPRTAIDDLPMETALPPAQDIAEAFGIVYVLEGSKLGGQFISRHVSEVLGLTPESGLRFFCGHGRETGSMWNEFRHAMADFAVKSGQEAATIKSAARTFDAFNAWLESAGAQS